MQIVEGKKIASLIKEDLIKTIKDKGLVKKLAIFYVGENPVITSFVELKKKFGQDVGVDVKVFKYEDSVEEDFLIKEIKEKSKDFNGVVVQLPLPEKLNRENILNAVPGEKDIDVLGNFSYQKFSSGDFKFLPPVVGAIDEVFRFYNIATEGKKIVVVGKGLLVGGPVFDWLKALKLNPVCVDEKTQNPDEIFKGADIIISGVGKSGIIKKEILKKGVVLVDAGSSLDAGRVVGDIGYECGEVASLFSRVPGGIGPITIAVLFRNMLYN